jgi:ATP-dependent DNA helicase RecG
VTGQVTPHVTPEVGKLLEALPGEMSRGELMEKLRLKDGMHFGMDYLQPSLAAGLIEITIPDKPRSSKQKYRLTDKGRQALHERRKARDEYLPTPHIALTGDQPPGERV